MLGFGLRSELAEGGPYCAGVMQCQVGVLGLYALGAGPAGLLVDGTRDVLSG